MERVINNVDVSVFFNIRSPGIYSMGNETANGKTYLKSILECEKGITVLTLEDIDVIMFKLKKFKESNNNILYIDRFDMLICKEIIQALEELEDRYVILDYKDDNYNDLLNAKYIVLNRKKDRFTLYA